MAQLLKGGPLAGKIKEALKEELKNIPKELGLGLIRMGSNADDISYEKSIIKQAQEIGIKTTSIEIPNDISPEEASSLIGGLNNDSSLAGILIFRPMQNPLVEEAIRGTLDPSKDVDGITSLSLSKQYSGLGPGFYPCTAEACMRILEYYGLNLQGKEVVVIGRSQVIGKPVAMMMLEKNATVTICHSKSENLEQTIKRADIVVAAIGKDRFIDGKYLSRGQFVVDVGINFDHEGSLHGDIDFQAAKDIVKAITPVPGGVGSVTTALLFAHTLEASKRRS